jgi:hypothetical protein
MEGQDIRGLMEAYSQVYETPEVLNEEVEQLDEMGSTRGNLPGGQDSKAAAEARMRANVQRAQAPVITTGRGSSGSYQRVAADKGAGGDAAYRAGGGNAAARSGLTRQQIQQKGMAATRAAAAKPAAKPNAPQRVIGDGSASGKPSVAPAKPAATSAPKPAPTATAKPTTPAAPAKPAPGTKAAGPESIKPKTPNPLMQRTFGYQTGNAPDQVAKASQGISKETSDKAFAKSKEMVKSIKPSADLKFEHLDIFDLVKGHLLDEGYAETEENALVMMANMSEEWRKSILEAHGVQLDEVSYSAKAARAGEDIGKPGKQFEKIAKEAGERYGSKERGEKVAGAVLAKLRAKKG